MAEFTAHYERKFSDGNFGSEGLSLSWTWTDQHDEADAQQEFDDGVMFLRKTVLVWLANSGNERVAWAAKRELEAPEREARIRESAETEYAAGIRDIVNAGADDDDPELPY